MGPGRLLDGLHHVFSPFLDLIDRLNLPEQFLFRDCFGGLRFECRRIARRQIGAEIRIGVSGGLGFSQSSTLPGLAGGCLLASVVMTAPSKRVDPRRHHWFEI